MRLLPKYSEGVENNQKNLDFNYKILPDSLASGIFITGRRFDLLVFKIINPIHKINHFSGGEAL